RSCDLVDDVIVVVDIRSQLPEHLEAEAVNRAYVHPPQRRVLSRRRNQLNVFPDAKFHLLSRLLSECKGDDRILGSSSTYPPRDTPGHDFRLPGPGSSDDQQTSGVSSNSRSLFVRKLG